MDIRCVRLVPYEIDGKVLLDIQQVLPLPEAADYQVRLRRKGLVVKSETRTKTTAAGQASEVSSQSALLALNAE
ncbi:MAG: hypothetical protein ABR540_20770 [Acidimicrobiales bacterium]